MTAAMPVIHMPRRIKGDGMTPRYKLYSPRKGVANTCRITSFYGRPSAFAHSGSAV